MSILKNEIKIIYTNMFRTKSAPIIFSRDCNGFQYYNNIDSQYNTPTIGNCIRVPQFIKLLEFFEYTYYFDHNYTTTFKNMKPSFKNEIIGDLKYPVGVIPFSLHSEYHNIDVHFQHDTDRIVIIEKWTRRMERFVKDLAINANNVFFFLNDNDLKECTEPFYIYIQRFFNIKIGNKVLFCKQATLDEISKHLKKEDLKKGITIVVPDNCIDGLKMYDYIKKSKQLDTILKIGSETNLKIGSETNLKIGYNTTENPHSFTVISKYFIQF